MTITIQGQQVTDALLRLKNSVSNMQPVFDEIGRNVRTNIDLCFRDGLSPNGINWAVLSPVTIAKKGSAVKLINHGVLRNSITYSAHSNFVEIGTSDKRAAMLNFGGTKTVFNHLWGDIPARPFFPDAQFPSDWAEDIVDIIEQHIGL